MVAYADLVLPDTTYLERHDCISLLDRPISEPDAVAGRDPLAGGATPDRDVRGFQSVLLDLGAPAAAARHGRARRQRRSTATMPTTSSATSAAPASARSPAGAARTATAAGRGAPNPDQLERYIADGGFCVRPTSPSEARFFKPWNTAYQDWAVAMGFFDSPQPYLFQLYAEPLAPLPGRRPRPRATASRRSTCASASPAPWRRCRSGTRRSPTRLDADAYPLHAITQRPAAMYHSWGSQNAWLRQIHGENPLYVPGAGLGGAGLRARRLGRRHLAARPRSACPVARMDAQNPQTVWTWNAIGKRPGAWALAPDAPEATPRLPAQPPDPGALPRPRPASRTPTRSPARPPGTTSACASSASRPPRAAARPSPRGCLPVPRPPDLVAFRAK